MKKPAKPKPKPKPLTPATRRNATHMAASAKRLAEKNYKPKPPAPEKTPLKDQLEERFGFTLPKVVETIIKHRGLLAHTAKALGIPQTTLQRYCKHAPEAEQAFKDAREEMGDFAENKLFQLIRQGDVRCILYYLSTVHRHRGYGLGRNDLGLGGDSNRPVYVETVNIVAVPSGQFVGKTIEHK